MGVGSLDRFLVGLHRGHIERRTRLELHGTCKIRILDLLIALEQHIVDHRTLFHLNDQRAAGLVDANIGKQTHGKKALHRSIDIRAGEGLARPYVDIIANRLSIDACIATHFDTADDGCLGHTDRCQGETSSTRSHKSH
ncbi:Uncharacterised protein [Brucella neotomae]|nr:Uncharacterised protein [Brucella neotomae]